MSGLGWIKLPRSDLDHPALQNATRRGVYDSLRLRAARERRGHSWRGQSIPLRPGQLVISVREFAAANEMNHKEMRLHLARLCRDQLLKLDTLKGTGRGALGTLVTLCDLSFLGLRTGAGTEGEGTARGTAGAQPGHTEERREETEKPEKRSESSGDPPRPVVPGKPGTTATRQPAKAVIEPRASRLPAEWTPSEIDHAYAAKQGLSHADIGRTAEDFRDYWTAQAGQRARKCDWPACWRRWVRNEAEKRHRVTRLVPGPGPGRAADAGRAKPGGTAAALAACLARRRGVDERGGFGR